MCRQRNKEEGLEHLVSCPKELSVFETEQPANTFDLVLSQDSLLHCGNERHHAVLEAARILKPGGFLVFTDIMQSDDADPEVCPWPLAPGPPPLNFLGSRFLPPPSPLTIYVTQRLRGKIHSNLKIPGRSRASCWPDQPCQPPPPERPLHPPDSQKVTGQ